MKDSLARSPRAITPSPSTSWDGVDRRQFDEIIELLADALVMDLKNYPKLADDSTPKLSKPS